MLNPHDLPSPDLVDYDSEALRVELERAAEDIDDEVRDLEKATVVTRDVLALEFTL